jgi:feruloyl-CoA synthase
LIRNTGRVREDGVLDLAEDFHRAPCRPIRFGDVGLEIERRDDGTLIVAARAPLVPYEENLLRRFWSYGESQGDKTWVAERDGEGWRRLSYGQAREHVSAVATWLKRRGVSAERSILVLSGNTPNHALWMLGAMAAGVPICSVSANYSLLSTDFERLRHVVDLVKPAVIFAETGDFARAAAAIAPKDAVIVTAEPAAC